MVQTAIIYIFPKRQVFMQFSIQYETEGYLRIRLNSGKFSEADEEILHYAFEDFDSIDRIRVFKSTGGLALHFHQDIRSKLIQHLNHLDLNDVQIPGNPITLKEIQSRKISPAVKRKIRKGMILEMCSDLVLPTPLQAAYHLYKIATLKDFA
jgi:hypothetical protein